MGIRSGHALVAVEGVEEPRPFFAFRLMASGVSFVKVFPHERLEAMLDGVGSALAFIGGVPRQLMFDNTSAIVREILGNRRRTETPEFRALAAHYGFQAVYANPGAGNEKGGAESLVRWAQRNLFSPVPRAASREELNARLLAECLADSQTRHRSGRLVADRWEEEQAHLGSLPSAAFPACRHRFARVDKTLLVTAAGSQGSQRGVCLWRGARKWSGNAASGPPSTTAAAAPSATSGPERHLTGVLASCTLGHEVLVFWGWLRRA